MPAQAAQPFESCAALVSIKLLRQPGAAHRGGLRGPVVVQHDDLGAGVVGVEVQHRVPDVAVPVVGRFAEDPDVDDETGSDPPLPRQAAVSAHGDLGAAYRDPRLVLFLRCPGAHAVSSWAGAVRRGARDSKERRDPSAPPRRV